MATDPNFDPNGYPGRAGLGLEVPAPSQTHRLEFRGVGREYFRIWAVNLALTIVTIGIYSAWAKVRTLRYFHSNTLLAGSAFGYHGEPVKILKGRLIALVLAALYFGAGRISPKASLLVAALLAVVTPWLVVRSRLFSMRVTSWRGLRFDFRKDYGGAYRSLLGWFVLGVITVGILIPRFLRERYRFIVTRTRFGTTAFDCTPRIGRFYRTAFGALGLGIAAAMIFAVLATVSISLWKLKLAQVLPAASGRVAGVTGALLAYGLVLAVAFAYTHARNFNEVLNHTTLGPHKVRCTLSARKLMELYFTNALAMVCTLGLFTPWARIRLARYQLQAVELECRGSLDDLVGRAELVVPGAAGEEISSFLDVDFGF
jgi:uncharacterized membrane protein YjgN (DUF898 family)